MLKVKYRKERLTDSCGNLTGLNQSRSRLYKRQSVFFLAIGMFIIAFGLATLSFPTNDTDRAWAYFFIGLGFGTLICADVSRRFEKRLP